MSIQDESFPQELFDEMDFSPHAGKRFQFPNDLREKIKDKLRVSSSKLKAVEENISQSSSTDQNLSSESSNQDLPLQVNSGKSIACDQDEDHLKMSDLLNNCQQNKPSPFQDIHSEYTRRRYKHVESKVAKYIANIKAEDQKHRQAKMQRHGSLPDTFSRHCVTDTNQTNKHFSAGELHHRLNESTSDADGEADSSENTTATTSSSSDGTARTTTTNSSTDRANKSPNDKEVLMQKIINEKDRIQSHNDYLQTRLDEKISENMRLKRNIDFMRIELANCKDKLVQKQNMSSTSLGVGIAGRLPLQMLLLSPSKSVKATQTDLKTPPPPQQPSLYITPDTPDANNNTMFDSESNTGKTGKTVATIQPLSLNFSNMVEQYNGEAINDNDGLRQRSNSNSSDLRVLNAKKNTKPNSSGSYPSSSDSAIDIESAGMASPKASKMLWKKERKNSQSQRREEFIYYDKLSGRYAALQALNVGDDIAAIYDENDESNARPESTTRKTKKPFSSLRRRWLRIFGPCTRCQDQNNTLECTALQQTYTQIPLLDKSFENHCHRNIR